MQNRFKAAAIALAAMMMAGTTPASATIFEYTMTNGDVLTIDKANGTGSWKGAKIDTNFTGDFSAFAGGPNPSFMGELTTLTGFRIINGTSQSPTTTNGNRTHPYMLKTKPHNRFNLWAWWGDPVVSGDYIRKVGEYSATHPPTDVPAPGVLALLGAALIALGFGRRTRRRITPT